MMFRVMVKTLAVAAVFSLANANSTELENQVLTQPCRYEGLIQFNQQVYYTGDKLEIHLVIPEQLKALLREDAEAHLLVYFPPGEMMAFPVANEGKQLEVLIESTTIVTGDYQLALVFTQRGGDATQIRDWYNGFAGLTSFGHLKISGGMPGSEASDVDGDGLIDELAFDENSESEVEENLEVKDDNSEAEAIGTVSVCVEESALTQRAEANDNSDAIESTPLATTAVAAKSSPLATTVFELKPSVDKALKVFSELKLVTDTYYAEMGRFPLNFNEISPFIAKQSHLLVADIKLNVENPFYYQLTLKDALEPTLAGKTLQFVYEPPTKRWFCRSGQKNGLEPQYLPSSCRH